MKARKPIKKKPLELRLLGEINNNPKLMGLLYDLDLMPEQLKEGTHDYWRMQRIALGFATGELK